MNHDINAVTNWISAQGESSTSAEREAAALAKKISNFGGKDLLGLLKALNELPELPLNADVEMVLSAAFARIYRLAQQDELDGRDTFAKLIPVIYRRLGSDARCRWQLLAALTAAGEGQPLADFARIMVEDPPREQFDAAAAIAPLFQRADYQPDVLFPHILDALAHPQAAPAVLDLANYLLRSRQVSTHPAADQSLRLIALLKGVCARLEALDVESADPAKVQQQVAESVAVAASLCDALGLIGDPQAATALRDALRLRHRRIRIEAAAALARLGDDDAAVALAELAEHPGVRLRALAYAEELGLLDHIDATWRTPTANAEAELACYLAEPQQLGSPPSAMELLDERAMAWPSYDDPQRCWLFRYTYQFGEASYTNIGIAGPLVHAFHVDLTQLPMDDVYAIFAGWQAEHPDIREIPPEQLNEAYQAIAEKLASRVAEENLEIQAVVALGIFFGEAALIGTARQGAALGAIVAGETDAAWFPHDGISQRPLGPDEAWCIWKGRRLLTAFNG